MTQSPSWAGLYTARAEGRQEPAPAMQFGEYVEQRLHSVADRLDADRDFWRTTMAGARPMALSPDVQIKRGELVFLC